MAVPDARRVVVTGLGAVHPHGIGAADYFDRALAAESSVSLVQLSIGRLQLEQPAVACRSFDSEALIGRPATAVSDRFTQMALAAALEAWRDSGAGTPGDEADDFGTSWGVGAGAAHTVEKGYTDYFIDGRERVSPLTVAQVMNNAAASQIAITLGLGGVCTTYSIACASSAVSIGEAFRRIRGGEASLMMAGGSEAPLSAAIMRAWDSMRVIPRVTADEAYRACRPFHARRGGLVLGEGAAALVLEELGHARARGARIYCEISGFGQSCDHGHLVRPDARGQVRAMAGALKDAGLSPSEVDYVNAHGTATLEGDPVEISAIRTLFGERAASIAVSATKAMHGHLLGATGAMEALMTVLAVHRQTVPPTAHLDAIDPACEGVRHVRGDPLSLDVDAALSNSFAFGGSNAVLVFRRLA